MLIMISSLCCYLGIERITYTCKFDNHGINGKKILRRKLGHYLGMYQNFLNIVHCSDYLK